VNYSGGKYSSPLNPLQAKQELANLQMPNHRKAVNITSGQDQRPESK